MSKKALSPEERARRWDERFWRRVNKNGPIVYPRLTPCWIWTGCTNARGYGTVMRDYQRMAVHRYTYELVNGPIPEGLLGCHHCDNPPCCNPEHIFPGTHSDNSQDMIAKGRHPACLPRLPDATVRSLRDFYGEGWSCERLGVAFEVSSTTVWRYVQDITPRPHAANRNSPASRARPRPFSNGGSA